MKFVAPVAVAADSGSDNDSDDDEAPKEKKLMKVIAYTYLKGEPFLLANAEISLIRVRVVCPVCVKYVCSHTNF